MRSKWCWLSEQIAKAREGAAPALATTDQTAAMTAASAKAATGGGEGGGKGASGLSPQHAYDVLLRPGHEGRVVGLALAISKPLMVSCGVDRTLRVWDMRRLSCQFVAPLNETPLSLTLHPDGMHLAIAFESGIALSHIGLDGLLPWRNIPLPAARVITYSHGGNLLLAAQGDRVAVFESYTLNMVALCEAHLAPVTSVAWAADDTAFTSGGADGMFYTWSAQSFTRVHEYKLFSALGAGVTALAVLAPKQWSKEGGGAAAAADQAEHTVLVVGGATAGERGGADAGAGHEHGGGGQKHEHGGSGGRGSGGRNRSPGGGRDSAREGSSDAKEGALVNPATILRSIEVTDEQGEARARGIPTRRTLASHLISLHASCTAAVAASTAALHPTEGRKLQSRASCRSRLAATRSAASSHCRALASPSAAPRLVPSSRWHARQTLRGLPKRVDPCGLTWARVLRCYRRTTSGSSSPPAPMARCLSLSGRRGFKTPRSRLV